MSKNLMALNDAIYRVISTRCKIPMKGLSKCDCIERSVYDLVSILKDTEVQNLLNIKNIPNIKTILNRFNC